MQIYWLFCRKDREGVLLQNPTVPLFLKILIAHTKYSKSLFFAVSCKVSSFYFQFSPITHLQIILGDPKSGFLFLQINLIFL